MLTGVWWQCSRQCHVLKVVFYFLVVSCPPPRTAHWISWVRMTFVFSTLHMATIYAIQIILEMVIQGLVE